MCYPDAAIDVVVLDITEEDAKTRSGLAKSHTAAALAWGHNGVDSVGCTTVVDGGTVARARPRPSGLIVGNGGVGTDTAPAQGTPWWDIGQWPRLLARRAVRLLGFDLCAWAKSRGGELVCR